MGKNQQVMTAARKNKNDEFYTLFHDIENECNHYKEFFRNKIVYCNCDNDSSSFFNYFVNILVFKNCHKVLAPTPYNLQLSTFNSQLSPPAPPVYLSQRFIGQR